MRRKMDRESESDGSVLNERNQGQEAQRNWSVWEKKASRRQMEQEQGAAKGFKGQRDKY